MKQQKKLLILTSTLLILSGCKEREEVHDVQYYLDHPEEIKKQLEKCRNNPGELGDTPNCKNALTASFREKKDLDRPLLNFKY